MITTKTGPICGAPAPCSREPIQSAARGLPIQTFMATTTIAVRSPTRLTLRYNTASGYKVKCETDDARRAPGRDAPGAARRGGKRVRGARLRGQLGRGGRRAGGL